MNGLFIMFEPVNVLVFIHRRRARVTGAQNDLGVRYRQNATPLK